MEGARVLCPLVRGVGFAEARVITRCLTQWMIMRLLLLACLGGAIGAGLRHLVSTGAYRMVGVAFPVGTLFVNVVGSFVMGIVVEIILHKFDGSTALRSFFATGVLGGFTTFSAFSLDFAQLFERGEYGLAMTYLTVSVVGSILALFAGLAMARMALQ
jgi:CrcB protein